MKKFNEQNELERMRLDPDNYIWGIIYYNTEDPRVILPKKNPYWGLTLNFGNPYSYVIMIIIVAFILVIEKLDV